MFWSQTLPPPIPPASPAADPHPPPRAAQVITLGSCIKVAFDKYTAEEAHLYVHAWVEGFSSAGVGVGAAEATGKDYAAVLPLLERRASLLFAGVQEKLLLGAPLF